MMKRRFFIIIAFVVGLVISGMAENDPKIGLNVGDKAPEIIELAINGKQIKLSELQGKMVLIDFWASWCGPCRRENPTVVSVYESYKEKPFKEGNGFTVFSVSLDKSKVAWEKAIKDDQLSWDYHVSDLKGWSAKYAAVYHVRGIPTNFLIDGNGIIVAKNLRGPNLNNTLKQLLK